MGAIVSARWPDSLAGAATDPDAIVNGLSVAYIVNAAIALVAAALVATAPLASLRVSHAPAAEATAAAS